MGKLLWWGVVFTIASIAIYCVPALWPLGMVLAFWGLVDDWVNPGEI
jgi:hypothetical protein